MSPEADAEQLADLALSHGISGFIFGGDSHTEAERLAAEIAPAVRDLVQRERHR